MTVEKNQMFQVVSEQLLVDTQLLHALLVATEPPNIPYIPVFMIVSELMMMCDW